MKKAVDTKVVFLRFAPEVLSAIKKEADFRNVSINRVMLDAWTACIKQSSTQLPLIPDVVAMNVVKAPTVPRGTANPDTKKAKAVVPVVASAPTATTATPAKGKKMAPTPASKVAPNLGVKDTQKKVVKHLPKTGVKVPPAKTSK